MKRRTKFSRNWIAYHSFHLTQFLSQKKIVMQTYINENRKGSREKSAPESVNSFARGAMEMCQFFPTSALWYFWRFHVIRAYVQWLPVIISIYFIYVFLHLYLKQTIYLKVGKFTIIVTAKYCLLSTIIYDAMILKSLTASRVPHGHRLLPEA